MKPAYRSSPSPKMESDVVSLLHPVQVFSRVCGVSPSLPTSQSVTTSSIIYSCVILVYPAWYFGSNFVKYYNFFKDVAAFTMSLSQIVAALNHFVRTGCPISVPQEFKKIYQTIRHAEDLLFSENIAQDEIPPQRIQCRWIFLTVLFATLTILDRFYSRLSFYEVTSDMIFYLSTMAYFYQLRGFLTLIKSKFKILNWHFNDLSSNTQSFLIKPISENDFFGSSEFWKKMFVQPQFASRKVSAKKIRTFNQIHFLLCSACLQLDSYSSLQNLLNTLQSGFVFITVPMFVFGNTFDEYKPIFSKITFFLRSADIIVNTVILMKLIHEVQLEAKRTALLVHQLIDEDHPAEVFSELEMFSQQLIQRRIKFSAFGFYDMDLKLLTSMVCTVVPVSLFLVQYHNRNIKVI